MVKQLIVAFDGSDVFISDGCNSTVGKLTPDGFIDAVPNRHPLAANVLIAAMPQVNSFIKDTPITEEDVEDGEIDTVITVTL